MWKQDTVQKNWQQLQTNPRYHSIGPRPGLLACDLPLGALRERRGTGRMAEPKQIINLVESLLHTQGKRDLVGKSILISAGGTREHLDPVRFLGNPSSGKMGIALAIAAHARGANVTLVHGPISTELLTSLPDIPRFAVVSAQEMHNCLIKLFPQQDWLIMSAAVGDVQPVNYSPQKLPKQDIPTNLPLQFIPDILSNLAQQKQPHQLLIGFAAQTGDIITPALAKLKSKHLDAIVANPVDMVNAGFNSDTNQGVFLDSQGGQKQIKSCTKLELAHDLFDFLLVIFYCRIQNEE
jgi:phosphopantothenoylcysteine decarboxylase/phosphopantothenate--cysteine ligase